MLTPRIRDAPDCLERLLTGLVSRNHLVRAEFDDLLFERVPVRLQILKDLVAFLPVGECLNFHVQRQTHEFTLNSSRTSILKENGLTGRPVSKRLINVRTRFGKVTL